jgi:hypothetical protein
VRLCSRGIILRIDGGSLWTRHNCDKLFGRGKCGVLRAKQSLEKAGKTLILTQTDGEFIAIIHWDSTQRG